ncbi:cuticle protein 10.9-like [Ixodes scapularis]|uniref:cuticle protein 10.9-like n=1 Tax=Ixodes scapularis TaxID=6945 RepID=UPI001A9FE899|nr:cuticle protein 10.9-like [Ixodes scapularis]
MFQVALLLACACVVAAQRFGVARQDEFYGPPIPYAFNYLSQLVDGSHSHEENGDGNGRVTGRYTLTDADGRTRTVTYTADENGFRAEVVTNELGTESKNPADVVFRSSAPTGPEAAIANEGNRLRAGPVVGGFRG